MSNKDESIAFGQSNSTIKSAVINMPTEFTTAIIAPARTESTAPNAYRLAKKANGELMLQGAYMWQEGWSNYGHEWRDIPTVELPEE